jgi:gluconate 5-dehydrogenase
MYSLEKLFNLKGKTALVVGGAGLLGSQICDALAEQGANIVIASRNIDACKNKSIELNTEYTQIRTSYTQVDLMDKQSINNCIKFVDEQFTSLDILVVCAWSGKKNTWETINDDDWNYDIEICLNGVFRLIKSATDSLKKSKGVILNIGSMYGHVAPDYRMYEGVPQSNPPSYGAAKAAVIQLTKYLSSFLAPYGIRVNCISPGPFPFEEVINQYPEFKNRLESKNPLGRIGKPHEIKAMAALLCSDASSYITGQNICIDGGWTVW